MQEAVKAISTMRGHDLRDVLLLAFGGAGPLHAGRLAQDLGMAGVIVPLFPGVYSAMGLVMSDVKHDYVRSRLSKLASIDEASVDAQFADLVAHARAELLAEGFAESAIEIERSLDMRYAGQGYELTMPLPATLGDGALRKLRADFDEAHRQQFGHTAPNEPVEIVSYRLRGIGRVPPVKLPSYTAQGFKTQDAIREYRDMRFDGRTLSCPVYQREKLDVGATFSGPAVVDQLDCTTVVFPGQQARVDNYKNIIITMGAA